MEEIDVNGKKIRIKEPLGEHQERYFMAIAKTQKIRENPEAGVEMLRVRYELVKELCGFETVEEVKKLPVSAINRIMEAIERMMRIGETEEIKNLKRQ